MSASIRPGRCIQFHGQNNMGKTTQVKELATRLEALGIRTHSVKFPNYGLLPHGETVRAYIKDPAFRTEYQARHSDAKQRIARLIAENHHHYEPTLHALLREGIWVLVEDGIVSSLAWTLVYGVESDEAYRLHQGLYLGDYHVLLNETNGDYFKCGVETGHANEGDRTQQQLAQEHMRVLLKRYVDHAIIKAMVSFTVSEPVEVISERIWNELRFPALFQHMHCPVQDQAVISTEAESHESKRK